MAATAEQKFNAAVKVIRGLPKNGSFQPSHELMLKFYAYFKQATEGPCTAPKPGIWNLVNRKKWEAWAELGEMPKEEAMLLYVDELKNIVETMPQTEQVADFVQTLDNFYELVEEGSSAKVRKHPNGSAIFNGSGGGDDFNHSQLVGEMLQINNNDVKTGSCDSSPAKGDGGGLNGVYNNGSGEDRHKELEEEEEEEEDEDDDEIRKAGEVQDLARVDSGSDTDEFCDTSDQMIQMPVKVKALNAAAGLSDMNTSTPVDSRRETRVRFAPDSYLQGDTNGNVIYNTGDRNSQRTQLLSERLGLGSPTGFSFLPQTTDFPPRHMTDSLYVNNSCSSLASLIGDNSIAGDYSAVGDPSAVSDFADDGSTLDGGGMSFVDGGDLVTSRGGGEEQGGSAQGYGATYPAGFGGTSSYAGSGRDSNRSVAGSSRRGLFPPGSGGGGQRPGGDGRGPQGGSPLEEQMLVTLLRLQQDMADVVTRLNKLETEMLRHGEEEERKVSSRKSSQPGWWPFSNMSKKMAFFVIVWPFVVPIIINLLCRRRRAQR